MASPDEILKLNYRPIKLNKYIPMVLFDRRQKVNLFDRSVMIKVYAAK